MVKCQRCEFPLEKCVLCNKPFELDKLSLKTSITIIGIVLNGVHGHFCNDCLQTRVHFSRVVE